jgi:hypothetical protein
MEGKCDALTMEILNASALRNVFAHLDHIGPRSCAPQAIPSSGFFLAVDFKIIKCCQNLRSNPSLVVTKERPYYVHGEV